MRINPFIKLTSLLVFFLFLFQIVSFAQNRIITGRVADPNGTGIPGVTVTVKGTTTSTQTSSDGSYRINAPANAVLVFTSVGYTSQEVDATGRSALDVALISGNTNLSEVVVIGYGTARKRDLTGAAVSVTSKNF